MYKRGGRKGGAVGGGGGWGVSPTGLATTSGPLRWNRTGNAEGGGLHYNCALRIHFMVSHTLFVVFFLAFCDPAVSSCGVLCQLRARAL